MVLHHGRRLGQEQHLDRIVLLLDVFPVQVVVMEVSVLGTAITVTTIVPRVLLRILPLVVLRVLLFMPPLLRRQR